MNLAEIQAALFSLVRGDRETKVAPEEVVGGGSLSPAQRVHVYAGMYVARTQDAIREDFPKVSQLLGEAFAPTVAAYVEGYPSTHFSLSMLGRQFPQYLRETAPGPLADLAQLEWMHCEVFVARDCEPATARALAGIDPERFAGAKLQFIPALQLAWLTHDVRALWRAVEAGEPAPELKPGKTPLLVWRKEHEVFHVALEPDEALAIEALQRGESLGAACEAFAERADPAAAAFTAIGSWFSESMVARVLL
ncbi:MAG: hypothetical protein H6Q89_913 [Myxococcaceae bacterium]|nr:hypothetical protein [Myxococcaceae bacterium]